MMNAKKCILVCNYFAKEVKAVVQSQNLQNIDVKIFPARCGKPPLHNHEIQELIISQNCAQHCILGSACLKEIRNKESDTSNLYYFDTCFEMILNKDLVNYYLKNGAYLVTPGWLNVWKQEIDNWGFTQKTASDFFQEICKQIILLDTGIIKDSSQQLDEFSSFVNLPPEIIPVGTGFLELVLSKIILQSNNRKIKSEGERKISDYSMMMDLLNDLAASLDESDVIGKIIELFSILFAPSTLFYLPVNKSEPGSLIANPVVENSIPIIENLLSCIEEEELTVSATGFQCQLMHNEELFGIIKINGMAFPQYREHYQNLAASVIQICALVISNARAYKQITDQKDQLTVTLHKLKETQKLLVESQKMASLGNLVAGIAHEINTPVGIGITATSGLVNKIAKLEALSRNNELTKSNFEKSLKNIKLAGELIFKNLQRTSNLIRSFKRVSVDEGSERIREFELISYMNDIMVNLAPQLKNKHIDVKINCAENILMYSYPGALAQVVTNLVINSIKHAFNDIPEASISINTKKAGELVHIRYADNGIGISEENLSKIFDPFFTTDKQEGSGLGLHIVYNIISQKLNGTIFCESKPGNGVVFDIKVPAKL